MQTLAEFLIITLNRRVQYMAGEPQHSHKLVPDRQRPLAVQNGWCTYMGQVILQFLHLFQGRVLRLGIFQQTPHVKHVVQVSLDLHRQLVALRVFAFLTGRSGVSGAASHRHTRVYQIHRFTSR